MTDYTILLSPDNMPTKTLYNGVGYVKLVDIMPQVVPNGRTGDLAIVQGARVSYGSINEVKSAKSDRALIRYLVEHYHTSPLEMAEVKFELRAPLFVIAQLVRHRTASLNSESRRYTETPPEFYQPSPRKQCTVNKQGSVPFEPSDTDYETIMTLYTEYNSKTESLYSDYKKLVDVGMAREVARCSLPQSAMSSIVWKCDLHNFVKMCRLRMASDAQLEIQELATAMFELVKPYFPYTIEAVEDFWFNSLTLSKYEVDLVKQHKVKRQDLPEIVSVLGKRQANEFIHKCETLGLK